MSNDTVARYLYNTPDFSNSAKELCNEAMLLGSEDNITAIVVDLRKRKKNIAIQKHIVSDNSGGRLQSNSSNQSTKKLD